MDNEIAAMLTWEEIVQVKDQKKQAQITKIINDFFDKEEHRKMRNRAQVYANFLNTKNKEKPDPQFEKIYGIYKNSDGKWKSSVKYMTKSN